MENKEYNTVRTILQPNTKIVERGKILNHSLPWLATDTSINSGGVQLGFRLFSEWFIYCSPSSKATNNEWIQYRKHIQQLYGKLRRNTEILYR